MHAVERLRRLPALSTHFRPLAIRAIESLRRAEVFGAVIHVRSLVLLLVAHDAYPFPSPSKSFPEPHERLLRTLTAPRDLRFYPRVR
jgi:hypothetical protein